MMVYDIALYTALAIMGIGLIHRIDSWFLRSVGTGERDIPPAERGAAALKGLFRALLGVKIFLVLKVLLVDVLFQFRILKDRKDPLVWFMHLCIFAGFLPLLLFHALGTVFGRWIAADYLPTVQPFLFLRNLSGILLLLGLLLAVIRRFLSRDRIRTGGTDILAIAILALIPLTGFLLESLKITSGREFRAMVNTYYGMDMKPDDFQALQLYWIEQYGLVAPAAATAHAADTVARGRELHENSCAACHAAPKAAFISWPLSRAMTPVAGVLDQGGMTRYFWYIHVLACCFGIAYLVFSKMFHIISTPISLLIAGVSGQDQEPAAAATRQVIELQGCSHGGACHEECPVRKRRMERIGDEASFEPMLVYIRQKSPADLGSRQVAG